MKAILNVKVCSQLQNYFYLNVRLTDRQFLIQKPTELFDGTEPFSIENQCDHNKPNKSIYPQEHPRSKTADCQRKRVFSLKFSMEVCAQGGVFSNKII